jgi:predicted enzyme related to lactoylglutathione lyase
MSERDGFQAGVPCWVDTWQDDRDGAAAFYADVFGWEIAAGAEYSMARKRGRDVAGFGSPTPDGIPAQWTTYVWVDDVDATAAKAREAGGSVVTEPFDALDGGRIAILADQRGATFGVWQPGEHQGAQVVNEPSAWAMSQVLTDDPEGSKEFYGTVFGWETQEFMEGVYVWRLPGFVGGEPEQPVPRDVVAVMAPVPEGVDPKWTVDFWVDDVDALTQKAAAGGGKVLAEPFDMPVGRSAALADPAGAPFSISKVSGK